MKTNQAFQAALSAYFKKKSIVCIFLTSFFLFAGLQLCAQKTWVAASSGNWSVAANWSGGAVPVSTDNVMLTPGAAYTITVDGNYSVNNLTVGTNATLAIGSTYSLTAGGNFSQTNGIFNGGTGTLNITGNFSQGGGTFNAGSGTVNVNGTFTKTTGVFNQGTGTLAFTGSAAQTISTNDATRSFYNLTINNASGLTIIAPATNLTISNNIAFTNGSLVIGSNTVTLNGTVSGMSASNNLTGSASSNLTVGGTGTLGSLFFNASTPGTTNRLNAFTLNRATGGQLTLGSDLNIQGALTLTNGLINTGSNNIIMTSTGSISRTNGYINGNLQKNVATGVISKTFEIGDASNYLPVTISFASVITAGDIVVSTASPLSSQPNIGSVFLNASAAVNRYWNLSSLNTLAFTNYNATFNFVAGDLIGGVSTSSLKAGIYNSGWAYPTMGTLTSTSSAITAATALGPVILASCLGPTAFSVTGGGAYCSGTSGAAIGLSGSETGVNYQLQLAGVNTGSPVAGTGAAISFANNTGAGTYTIIATRTATGCVSAMSGSVSISIDPLPSISITGLTTICSGTTSLVMNYNTPVNAPDQYAVVWGPAAAAAGFTDMPFTALSGGTFTINGMLGTAGNFAVNVYVKNSTTGCQNSVTNAVVCGSVAENQTLTMTSPNGNAFTAINFASYGTPTGTCGSYAVSACHATTSMSVVQAAAIGQTSFSIAATNGVFGDPCNGTVKKLYVEAVCGFSITISPTLTATISGTTAICSGSSTTLTASSAPNYSWSTGATTQSITVSPTSSTTYSVTVSNPGCSSGTSQLVTVNGIPSVTLLTSTPAVCSGITSTSVNYTSPLNSPDQYSIAWSTAGIAAGLTNVSNATLSGGVINLTGITTTAGNYGATITISNSSTGCYSSIASGSMCGTANENTTLTMTAPFGAKYIGINFASYGTPTGTCGSFATSACHSLTSLTQVQNAALGNNSFSIAASNGIFGDPCSGTVKKLYVEATYSTFVLTVNAIPAAPTAGSNSPVCVGNNINLTASTMAGASYSWTGPSGFTAAIQNPSIISATIAMAGTYSVMSTVAGCNSASTGNVSVLVNTPPSATISYTGSPFCGSLAAQAVNITGTTGGTFSSTAGLNINSSTGAINPSLSSGGVYTVTYTIAASGGCSIYTATTSITITAIPAAPTAGANSPVCAGNTINLTASTITGASYAWTGPSGFSSSVQNPSIASATTLMGGTYSVRATVAGCSGTSTGNISVVVNTPPLATISYSGIPFCKTSTTQAVTLTGTTGGAFSAPAAVSINAGTGAINPSLSTAGGPYTITYTVAASGGCSLYSTTTTVTVNATAAPVATSNSPVCAGNTINLFASTVAGATYSWTGPSGFTSSSQNPARATATTVMSGTYYVTSTISGCSTVTPGSVAVTVNAAPSATIGYSGTPFCSAATSQSVNLAGTSGGTFSAPATVSINAATGAINPSLSTVGGPYTITYTVAAAGGCSLYSTTTTISINQTPAAPTAGSNSPVCSGNNITLTASAISGATYSWTGPASYTSALQNPTITSATIAMAGTYNVRSTVAGCNSISTGAVVVAVNAAPSATISYTGSPFCMSSTSQVVTLTGTGGGAFSAPAALSISPGTGTINPSLSTAGGPYTVTYSISASGGCATYTTTTPVSILAIPTATVVSGAGSYCTTKTITATGGTGGTIYFQGTTSGGTSTSTASASQVITTSGIYYFRARNASGCWGVEGSVAVVIDAVATCTGASMAAYSCSGGGGTVNITGLVPNSTNNTISYSINGVAQTPITGVNANSLGNASFNTVSLTTANNGQTLQVTNIAHGSCNTALSYSITLVVTGPGMWVGVNNDWNDIQNWCGGVPASTADVTFPAGRTFYPVISSGSIQVNNLVIAPGASVTVTNSSLKISGTISNSGTLTASAGTIELMGTLGAQAISGSMFNGHSIKNLIISNSNGVSFSGTNDTVKITGTLSFGTSNATLSTNSNLTLISNAAGTASVADMTNGGANSGNNIIGNTTVERYVPMHPKAWQLLATPTNGQTIKNAWQEGNSALSNSLNQGYGTIITSPNAGAVSLGFDVYTPAGGASMKSYNPATNAWDGVAGTSISISNKKGYMFFVRGDRSIITSSAPATATTLRTTGQLFTTGSYAPPSTTVLAGKFESIGNPYASALDFRLITKPAAPAIDDAFYVWDPLLTNNYNGLGGYQTITAANGWKPIPGGTADYDAGTAYPVIQSGQAFLVHATGSGGTISFDESNKANQYSMANRQVARIEQRQFLRISLYTGGMMSDGNVVSFDEDFNNDYDASDALKILNSNENFGIKKADKLLALEARAPVITEDTIFYSMNNMHRPSYQLKFNPENMALGLMAQLADKFMHTMTDISLTDTSSINFNITGEAGSYAADRFYLVFKQVPTVITSISGSRNPANGHLVVNWTVTHESAVLNYEMQRSNDGANFTAVNYTDPGGNDFGTYSYGATDLNPLRGTGYYRIKGEKTNGLAFYSNVIRMVPVKAGTDNKNGNENQVAVNALVDEPEATGISIYPNPVVNNIVNLEFTGHEAGSYKIDVIDKSGKTVFTTKVTLKQGIRSSQRIQLDKSIPAGLYQVRIITPASKTLNKQIVIL